MRTNSKRVRAERRLWWLARVPLAVGGIVGCGSNTTREQAVKAELVRAVGVPLPDAAVRDTPWYRGAGAWYDHSSNVPAIIDWYRNLPDRLDCDDVKMSDLAPPEAGRFALDDLSCTVERDGIRYVVSVMTLDSVDHGSTSVGVRIDSNE